MNWQDKLLHVHAVGPELLLPLHGGSMRQTITPTDLDGRLLELFDLPEAERKGVAVKEDLFTRLAYQPKRLHATALHDIALTQDMTDEEARSEFAEFLKETERRRKNQEHKLTPDAPATRAIENTPKPTIENAAPLSICLAEVEAKPVPWLWPDFIPRGCATMIVGNPGDGKTWLSLDTAARLSRGSKWVDGTPIGNPANTIFLSIEDDPATAIRPRFDSLNGDSSRLFVYNAGQAEHLDLSKLGGLDRLRTEIERIGDVQLVIIDPIADFGGSTNANAAEEVRGLLGPLIGMANDLDFALLLIGHLNKSQGASALYRAAGSASGWLGVCRAAFMVFRDQDDKKLRHVAALKANYARDDPPQLEFRIQQGRLEGRVAIEEVDVDEMLQPKIGRKPREKDQVLDWLGSFFDGRDEVPALEIEEAAKASGFNMTTLKRAKAAGGYISKRIKLPGGKDGWAWQRVTISEVGHA